jgi:hypothetical protein
MLKRRACQRNVTKNVHSDYGYEHAEEHAQWHMVNTQRINKGPTYRISHLVAVGLIPFHAQGASKLDTPQFRTHFIDQAVELEIHYPKPQFGGYDSESTTSKTPSSITTGASYESPMSHRPLESEQDADRHILARVQV